MAWTYYDYESQSTTAEKRARLELHIAEVSAEVGPDLSIAGRSRTHSALVSYLQQLQARLKELEVDTTVGYTTASVKARSAFTYGRPV